VHDSQADGHTAQPLRFWQWAGTGFAHSAFIFFIPFYTLCAAENSQCRCASALALPAAEVLAASGASRLRPTRSSFAPVRAARSRRGYADARRAVTLKLLVMHTSIGLVNIFWMVLSIIAWCGPVRTHAPT
jgi:hypothetical protein